MEKTLFVRLLGDSPKIRILDMLITGRELDYSISDIASQAGIGRATFYKMMDGMLQSKVIVRTRRLGNMQLYRINEKNSFVKKLIFFYDSVAKKASERATREILNKIWKPKWILSIMKYDLIIVGNVAFDENIINNKKYVNFSGAAYLWAVPASLFSKNIGIVTRIGEDYPLEKLKGLGVDIKGVKQIKGEKTTRFYHTYLSKDGSERTFRGEMNVGNDLNPDDLPSEYYDSKYIHVATNLPDKQIEFIKRIKENSDAIISIDTLEQYIEKYRDKVIEAFGMADIIFVDKREKNLISDFKFKTMVVKKGKEGAEYHEDDKVVKVRTVERKVVDKTGAGDVLAGVFLVLRAKDRDIKEALTKAVEVASRSVTQHGVDFLKNWSNFVTNYRRQ